MKYKKNKKQLKKALSVRGGFTGKGFTRGAIGLYNRTPKSLRSYAASRLVQILRNSKSAQDLFDSASDAIKGVETVFKQVHKRGKNGRFKTLEKVSSDPSSIFNEGSDEVTAASVEGVAVSKQGDASNRKTSFYKLVTGMPTTKALKRLAKEEGVVENVLYDTIVQYTDDVSRADMILQTGFNQKFQGISGRSYLTLANIAYLLNLPNEVPGKDDSADRSLYASFLSYTTKLRFANTTGNVASKLKIHICTIDPRSTQSPIDLVRFSINPTSGSSADEGMPLTFQLRDRFVGYAPGEALLHTYVDPSTRGLFASNYWKANGKIVKTISRTLQPDEIFTFTHTNSCGPGLRWDKAAAEYNSVGAGTLPLEYFYIFELNGSMVDVYKKDTPLRYIGTGPCMLAWEAAHSVKFVQGETRTPGDYVDGTQYPSRFKVHVREFIRDGYPTDFGGEPSTIFNKNIADFADTGDYRIVTMSDEKQTSFSLN